MSEPALRVLGLTRLYDERVAVDGLDFSVAPGEILGLVGPNGAGKTTTLRAIAGILKPHRGSVHIAGIDLARDPVAAKRRLGFVPDEPRLFDYLTVSEHIEFTARVFGVADAGPRAEALLEDLELADRRHALPATLSRGMKQKLSVLCALLHDPALLVFDEPLTGLDPLGIRRLKEVIRARARAGIAVLLSSHLLGLVEELCDRVLLLDRGRKVLHGTLDEIRAALPGLTADASLEEMFVRAVAGSAPAGPVPPGSADA